MSKRGTENQITKDDYAGDDDDENVQLGTFKKASQDELARRPMKSLRRTKASEAPEQKSAFTQGASQESDAPASSSVPAPASATAAPATNSFSSFTASAPTSAAKNTGVFASPFGSTFAPAATTAAGNASPFANPFASSSTTPAATTAAASTGLFTSSFGSANKPAPTTAVSNASTTGSITTSAPANASGGVNPFASISPARATATASGNANPFSGASTSAFSKGSFTFNVGSNANTISVPSAGSGALSGDGSQDKVDHEAYERLIRGVNQSFYKKIQKELEHNPTVNLSLIFNQYIDHRHKVRKTCLGIDEPNKSRGVTGRNQSEAGPGIRMTSIAGIPVESASAPKLSFGLPLNETGEKPPAKPAFPGFGLPAAATTSAASPAASTSSAVAPGTPSTSLGGTSPFSFGSSSIKGAVDPPKNPTSTGWGFATPGSQTSTNLFPSFGAASTATTTAATSTTTTTTTTASTSAPSTSTLFPSVTPGSTSGDAPKPFLFSPKPFEFNPPKPAEAAAAPKPFAFQIPSGASSPFSDAGPSSANQADNEKMPDDTKAQLVETREGEEDEETVFEVRAKLYAMIAGEYKDVGVGIFRVNENKETKKRRMIMRTGGTGLIALNSWVIPGMGAKIEKNNVTVFAFEGDKPKKFLVRVKEVKAAEELFKELEAGQIKS
ncbi:hypothetical protein BGZ70_006627 [Mortierella alpina]|uniref:RanBD1 domain-containing protein n=1 Tax=Mortierella alpina TaxID=64518 RepID=A0A9P6J7R1_MORAP|nr:hypothetical protein BGZ70_006627 [Mortierella alpina]